MSKSGNERNNTGTHQKMNSSTPYSTVNQLSPGPNSSKDQGQPKTCVLLLWVPGTSFLFAKISIHDDGKQPNVSRYPWPMMQSDARCDGDKLMFRKKST